MCVDDVCADPSETRTFPGPCVSRIHAVDDNGHDNLTTGDFAYDGAGQLFRVTSTADFWGGAMQNTHRHIIRESFWAYDERGDVVSIEGESTWRFEADRVIEGQPGGQSIFDRASFAFMPLVGRESLLAPAAVLGLRSNESGSQRYTYSWTRNGNVLTLTRTDTGDGSTKAEEYTLDDRGRIIRWHVADAEGRWAQRDWVFEGDLLVDTTYIADYSNDRTHYTYDAGGNLIEQAWLDERGRASSPEVYAYECWK